MPNLCDQAQQVRDAELQRALQKCSESYQASHSGRRHYVVLIDDGNGVMESTAEWTYEERVAFLEGLWPGDEFAIRYEDEVGLTRVCGNSAALVDELWGRTFPEQDGC